MKPRLSVLLGKLLVLLGVSLASTSALAAYVNCPGSANTNDREFGVDPGGSCYAYGPGNTSAQNTSFKSQVIDQGWTFREKDESDNQGPGSLVQITGQGTASGGFKLNVPYEQFLFVLKSGEGQRDPDWAAFLYSGPVSIQDGLWRIVPSQAGGLSHVEIWTKGGTVAEPATLALLGLGLVGIAALRRRRGAPGGV